MSSKLRDKAKKAPAPAHVPLEIPEWELTGPDTAYIKVWSARDRVKWEELAAGDKASKGDAITFGVLLALVGADGKPIFDAAADLPWLQDQPAHLLLRIYREVGKVNKLTKEASEDLAKNSETQ